jgi:nicotinamide-nucleotide amidase
VDTHPAQDLPQIIAQVAERLLSQRWQLVTAESCTGGWIAKACTDRPGSSQWFRGGVVAYTNELKTALLGVRPQTLAGDGAVSEATVREMALGALERLGGDVAVAVSGIAGPDGGSPGRPVGTVWFAWASMVSGLQDVQDVQDAPARVDRRAPPIVRTARHRFDGDRDAVRRQAVAVALHGVVET